MTQYLSQQQLLRLLFFAFILGAALGAVYQIFLIRRAAFRQMKIPRIPAVLLLNIEDFLFMVCAGVAISILFFACSHGVVRLMAFPALGVGFLLWRMTLGRFINACTDGILRILAWCGRLFLRRILLPILRMLDKTFRKVVGAWTYRKRKRDYRRLVRRAKKETHRYTVALFQAAGQGVLSDRRLADSSGVKRRKSELRKTNENRGSMKMKNRGNIFVKLLWVGFVILALFSIVTSQFKINELNDQREELEQMVIAEQDEVDEITYDLERPIDDNYIIEFAREKLGLNLPGDTIFHYDVRK